MAANIYTKHILKNARIAEKWCIRDNGAGGLKLTYYVAAKRETVGDLVFKEGLQTKEGHELNILSFHLENDMLYVQCDGNIFYRILMMNMHDKRKDTCDELVKKLVKKVQQC